jgi:hypothetical protein
MKKLSVLFLFFLCSCKSIQHESTVITIDFKCLNDDIVRLFYTDNETPEFSVENMLSEHIKGKNQFQTIIFEIPKEKRLTSFRIDLGENRIETPVFIKEITINYGEQELIMSDKRLSRYFKENIYVETSDYYEFGRKSVDNRYDPFLKSTALLEQHMYLKFR